ncbi:4-phosphoerythronate dehydrogenase [Psychrobacter sanguinis]|uniref:4-phosphoerythronate dehydrogenase n=1 Tax=Psychrobacter sanguinis TaxID=861445 RepID=UPI00020C7F4B|nr:4-phosphoerythronate dehydrogenase [Psychrobacter sanguinis]EGK07528.1 4-phosphoerythronate dehydrogenase [Psychrobacter sp. 1501(2011)]MCC3309264.1 4-phosphoerythronate dehydrogenase [Psychrobacter sanguinis]MCD9151972.1 4-phosphoerythronate dehydrogenase [Psychrobacter sanguinis]MDY3307643.1 4-phosphoerythronate dehydrogenase [Psychrobacter sanguinis]UEC26539.1 4-phosphoerythronate dehydrogenase [Psychrobacter sanguinis]
MLTILADSNIAHLHDYFNERILQQTINVIAVAGRDIDAAMIAEYQPDALLIRSVTQVNAELLKDNDSVKYVGSATIGTDHVDQDYLRERGIYFSNAAGCSKHSVAQYVLTAIFNLRPQYWLSDNSGISDSQAVSVRLGIIGLGNIGSTLAGYAADLGWKVLGYDPLLPASDINNASFEQVLTQSDVISLHVPLTEVEDSDYPTYHLIDKQALTKIPNTTILINSARGPVISEADLLLDFDNNPQRQVVLDVFEHEPVVTAGLLNKLSIATPHIAGYTLEGKLRGTQIIFDEFLNVFGPQGLGEVAVEAVYLMDELLPENPYRWQQLKQAPEQLPKFYDIEADGALLRESVDNEAHAVLGPDFDALRKNYALRREWLFQ